MFRELFMAFFLCVHIKFDQLLYQSHLSILILAQFTRSCWTEVTDGIFFCGFAV